MEKQYPCRTEVVNKIQYSLQTFVNERLCSSQTLYSKEEVDKAIKNYNEHVPEWTCKVTEHHYTETVCIECGREEF